MSITMLAPVDLSVGEFAVYKNLRNGQWSVAQVKGADNRGTVVAYATELAMVGARAVVKESRRRAIEAGGHREVCAWFIGRIVDGDAIPEPSADARVTFRPRERASFFRIDTDGVEHEDVTGAGALWFSPCGSAYIAAPF